MNKQPNNRTALPEPSRKFSLGYDNSHLSSGSAVLNNGDMVALVNMKGKPYDDRVMPKSPLNL